MLRPQTERCSKGLLKLGVNKGQQFAQGDLLWTLAERDCLSGLFVALELLVDVLSVEGRRIEEFTQPDTEPQVFVQRSALAGRDQLLVGPRATAAFNGASPATARAGRIALLIAVRIVVVGKPQSKALLFKADVVLPSIREIVGVEKRLAFTQLQGGQET